MTPYVKRGKEIYFTQRNGAPWEDLPYWDGKVDYRGCGLVSMTMCIDLVTEQNLTPADVYRMRKEAGLAQDRVVDLEGTSVCGGDVQRQLNQSNAALFGIHSREMERSVEGFKKALAEEKTAIWASSANTAFYDKEGNERVPVTGHVLCIWHYEEGYFWVKDPALGKERGNDILWSEEQMDTWLKARPYQHWAISPAEEI